MNTITKNTVIVERVSEGKHAWEYQIGENVELTLVFSVEVSKDIRIVPSVYLLGNGSKATIIGIVRGAGTAHVDIRTLQHHIGTGTTSNLLVKCVLDGSATSDYTGSIVVDRTAQKTDAYQRNENLLLGGDTRATSSPVLEILANDVRCTHGAIVKSVDPFEIWYLESRGIDPSVARDMIASGFLSSAFSRIEDAVVRRDVEAELFGDMNV